MKRYQNWVLGALLFTGAILFLYAAPVHAQCEHVRFWNRLDSTEDIFNSEIGVGGQVTEPIAFSPMQHGNGVALSSSSSQVKFSDIFDSSFPDAGTIAFWWQPGRDENSSTGSHRDQRVAVSITSDQTLSNGWPEVQIRVADHSGNFSNRTHIFFSVGEAAREDFIALEYDLNYHAGDLLHLAVTWDKSLGATPIKTYVNGELVTAAWEQTHNPELVIQGIQEKLNSLDSTHDLELLRRSKGLTVSDLFDPEQYIDNLVVYDEALTDFSNRFQAHPCCDLDPKFKRRTVQIGAKYYSDRTYTLTYVPVQYAGMTMITTPNDEKKDRSDSGYLTFEMPNDGNLYVAYDSRAANLPNWMYDFYATGDSLLTSLSTQDRLNIYVRAYYRPGDCVDLGGNFGEGASNEYRSNFVVFFGEELPPANCPPDLDPRFGQTVLEEGARYYTDRTYTLTKVPRGLRGMSMYQTPNNDRNRTDPNGYLRFEIPDTTYTNLFVAFDRRARTLPEWMNGFADTGMRIYTSLGTQKYLKVYYTGIRYPDYLCQDLGANKAPGFTGAVVSNYIVFSCSSDWSFLCGICDSPDPRFEETNLRVGMRYYTDRNYTITQAPEKYIGMDMIITPNDDRKRKDAAGYLTKPFPNPWDDVWQHIYVAFDRRTSALPDWMSDFEDTGDVIHTTLSTQVYLKIYHKEAGGGFCLNLGGNYGPGSSNENRSNYFVMVEEFYP